MRDGEERERTQCNIVPIQVQIDLRSAWNRRRVSFAPRQTKLAAAVPLNRKQLMFPECENNAIYLIWLDSIRIWIICSFFSVSYSFTQNFYQSGGRQQKAACRAHNNESSFQ